MAFRIRTIRARLTLWYTLLVFSTLVLFGAVSYYITRATLSENLDISLKNEVRWVRDFIQPQASKVKPSKRSIDNLLERGTRPIDALRQAETDSTKEEADEIWNQIFRHTLHSPKKTYIQFADRRGVIIYRSYNLATDSLTVTDTVGVNQIIVTTGRLNDEPIRVAAARDRNFTYLVGYPVAEVQDLLENLYGIFLLLVPIAVTISIIGGLALANKSLRPVEEITTRARRITAENLDQTIPVRDVDDELGRLTSTINDMIRRLRYSFSQVREFSADASHELRTPLTIMRGEIELALRNPKTPSEYRQVLESTLEEILRMSSIINNLLLLAKADQGLYEATFSEVNLKELMDELFEDCTIMAGQKKICLKWEESTPVTIVGDRERLRQLFLNLVDNAIKYTGEGGTITLGVGRMDGRAVVRIADTGIGIPQDEIHRIFDRFYRVDKARSREMGGTGLGLSIAKWIAELHRGRIAVTSEVKKGSLFTVVLPIQ